MATLAVGSRCRTTEQENRYVDRAATILAAAAVISSLCIYATFAQDEVSERPTSGAIVVGPAPIRLQQALPGR